VTREGPEGSNPSPGALIEGISEGYKADGERTAGNQRIDIIENFCNRLTEAATTTTTVLLRPEAVQSSAVISRDPAEAAERKRLTAEEGLQALDKRTYVPALLLKR
jgi:hypothetical protein